MGGKKAQAGVVEFLILTLIMLFLFQQAVVLSQKAKKTSLTMFERAIVESSLDKVGFAVREVNLTGFGRKKVEIPQKPFIKYRAESENEKLFLSAFFEDSEFIGNLTLSGAVVDCRAEADNLTILVQSWGNRTEVIC